MCKQMHTAQPLPQIFWHQITLIGILHTQRRDGAKASHGKAISRSMLGGPLQGERAPCMAAAAPAPRARARGPQPHTPC